MSVDYDDTTKTISDFFSKPFPSNNSVKISTETKADCLSLKTATTRSLVKDDKDTKEVFETTVEPKYEFKDLCNLEMKLQTSNALSVTVAKPDLFTKGFKLSLNGTQAFPKGDVNQTVGATAEYKHEKFFLKLSGGYPMEDNRAFPLSGNLVINPAEGILVGTKFNFEYSKANDAKLNKEVEVKVAGSFGKTLGFVACSLDQKASLAVLHTVSDTHSVGLNVKASPGKATEELKNPAHVIGVDIAGQHKLTKQTTLNGKLNVADVKNPGFRIGFGFQQQLNCCHAVAIVGADINISSLIGKSVGGGHSLGFELKLKD